MRHLIHAAALVLLVSCSKESVSSTEQEALEASGYASGYNFYRTPSAEDFQNFKSIILDWAGRNGYQITDPELPKISKNYAPGCFGTIWIEGKTPGTFKLMQSRKFQGSVTIVNKATQDGNAEGASLFNAVKAYYLPP